MFREYWRPDKLVNVTLAPSLQKYVLGRFCNIPVKLWKHQPICTFSCTSVFLLIFINPQYTVLHILSHCTSYSSYFIICSYFHSLLYLYIYIISCVMFHCFIAYVIFILFSILLLLLYFFFCTFHWADLSWPTFHYGLYPVWLCMWQIIKNLEPWTLNHHVSSKCQIKKKLKFFLVLLILSECSEAIRH